MNEHLPKLDERASGFSALRVLPNGEPREYAAMHGPRWALELLLRQAVSGVTAASADSYAILDVRDDENNIIQDYGIPDARSFRWWYRKLGWRVESPEPSVRFEHAHLGPSVDLGGKAE